MDPGKDRMQIQSRLSEHGIQPTVQRLQIAELLFAQKGLLKPLQVDPERGLFDSNMAPHHHFHVEDTGELIDVPPGAVEFSRLPPLPPGTESVSVEVVIRVRRQN
jgi:Fur family iron response transcriptional regulator